MGLWSRLRRTIREGRHGADISEKLQFHLDLDVAHGHSPGDARMRLGSVTGIVEETRAMGIIEWLDSALRDARHGLRQVRRTPALTLAMVLSLTVGIGANTAIFSLIDAAILKPLPVREPDSLRIVEWTNNGFPVTASNINGDFNRLSGGRVQASSVAANLYRRLAREQSGFDTLIGIADPVSIALTMEASPAEQVSLQYVSSDFFQGLGLLPQVGRPFREEEDRVGQEPVVIVSDRFWARRLGGAQDVLDRIVRINSVP